MHHGVIETINYKTQAILKEYALIVRKRFNMAIYKCTLCGWEYDEEEGYEEEGIEPGTKFEDLPDDFACARCGAGKEYFEKAE